jgi:hypothetical protein
MLKRNPKIKKIEMEKFAIIGGDIHKLIHIDPKKEWNHAWRIESDKKDWYWIPIANELKENPKFSRKCSECGQFKWPWRQDELSNDCK